MLCENCNHICPEGSRFCPMCGKPLPDTPPEPIADIPLPPEPEDIPAEPDGVVILPEILPEAPAETDIPPQEPPVEAAPAPESPPLLPPPPKKGSPLPPILIMVGMVIVGLILFLVTTASPDYSTEIPWFEMDENGLVTFVESEYSGNWEITVPDTLRGLTVTGLAENCFAYSGVVTVELPDTLETIGTGAFLGCTSLRGLFLPEGVKTIESYAFAGCSSLEAICVPGTVTMIGSDAFQSSGKLHFVFFSGDYKSWTALYPDYICPQTYIICLDGAYLQGTEAP